MFGTGISYTGEVVDIGSKLKIIDKSGTWFSYNDERLGQGRENARTYLLEHPEVLESLKKDIFEKSGLNSSDKNREEE